MKQRGFTLIELMVVVVIIGVLASIIVPMYHQYLEKNKHRISKPPINTAASITIPTYHQYLENDKRGISKPPTNPSTQPILRNYYPSTQPILRNYLPNNSRSATIVTLKQHSDGTVFACKVDGKKTCYEVR